VPYYKGCCGSLFSYGTNGARSFKNEWVFNGKINLVIVIKWITCSIENKIGVVFMFDIALILFIASAGGVIAITGFLVILGRRILEPKKELQQKIDKLEEEVQKLKNHK
jgi:hypothetical protein